MNDTNTVKLFCKYTRYYNNRFLLYSIKNLMFGQF